MPRDRNSLATVTGRMLGPPMLYLLARVLGTGAMVGLAGCLSLVVLLLMLGVARGRFRLRRLQRQFCDDAIAYARQARRADGAPDFTAAELAEVSRLRRRLDYAAIHQLVAASNRALPARPPKATTLSPNQWKAVYTGAD